MLFKVNGIAVRRNTVKYQIESSHPMVGPLLPEGGTSVLRLHDHALAVAVAAKSVTVPIGKEIRVVHRISGEVIFRNTAAVTAPQGED